MLKIVSTRWIVRIYQLSTLVKLAMENYQVTLFTRVNGESTTLFGMGNRPLVSRTSEMEYLLVRQPPNQITPQYILIMLHNYVIIQL